MFCLQWHLLFYKIVSFHFGKKMHLDLKKTFFCSLLPALLVLSSYFLIYLPVEFLVTEAWMITPKVSSLVSVFFLMASAAPFVFIDLKRLLEFRWRRLFLISILAVSGFVYKEYRREKLAREYLPKIYNISPSWGIQAQLIEIRGVNFFPIWKKGKILFNGQEMIIKSWNEELIIAEQPVPAGFGKTTLFIVRSDGIISNKLPFEVRDPSTLK